MHTGLLGSMAVLLDRPKELGLKATWEGALLVGKVPCVVNVSTGALTEAI